MGHGGRGTAATHQQQQHNGENPIAVKTAAVSAPVLLLSSRKRMITTAASGLQQQQLSTSLPPWLPLHASLALNLALVYYVMCINIAAAPGTHQHSNRGQQQLVPGSTSRQQDAARCSSSSNDHELLLQQQQGGANRDYRFCSCNNNSSSSTSAARAHKKPVQDFVFHDDDVQRPVTSAPHLSSSALEHAHECSSNGHFVVFDQQQQQQHEQQRSSRDRDDQLQQRRRRRRTGACHCHACFKGPQCAELATDCILNLSFGDPTMFESYWLALGSQATTSIPAWQGMSYFAHKHNAFLFVDPYLEQAIRELHSLVGNAVTKNRHIVVGVGSTQLFQAAIYALVSLQQPQAAAANSSTTPTDIVSAVPYYSAYPEVVSFQQSGKYRWAGDASKFQQGNADQKAAYIEIVISPNNPEGSIRQAVLQDDASSYGSTIHDLAYYWPQYTPITATADYPVMLFTFSKITGHAGTRLGWAIVEDVRVATKMSEFIKVNTVGVSQDSQLRATTLIHTIINGHKQAKMKQKHVKDNDGEEEEEEEDLVDCNTQQKQWRPFFHYGQTILEERWRQLLLVLEGHSLFNIPTYDQAFCSFLHKSFQPNPAFLWLECTDGQDCHQLLLKHRIVTRDGPSFGASSAFVRLSLLDRDSLFDLLLQRLASLR